VVLCPHLKGKKRGSVAVVPIQEPVSMNTELPATLDRKIWGFPVPKIFGVKRSQISARILLSPYGGDNLPREYFALHLLPIEPKRLNDRLQDRPLSVRFEVDLVVPRAYSWIINPYLSNRDEKISVDYFCGEGKFPKARFSYQDFVNTLTEVYSKKPYSINLYFDSIPQDIIHVVTDIVMDSGLRLDSNLEGREVPKDYLDNGPINFRKGEVRRTDHLDKKYISVNGGDTDLFIMCQSYYDSHSQLHRPPAEVSLSSLDGSLDEQVYSVFCKILEVLHRSKIPLLTCHNPQKYLKTDKFDIDYHGRCAMDLGKLSNK